MALRRAITFGPLDAVEALAELAVLRRPMIVSAGAWHGEILELSAERHVEMLDVTTFGDAAQRYAPGLRSVTVRMKTSYDPDIGMPPGGEEIQFDEQLTMGGQVVRLQGRVVVTRCEIFAPFDGLATAEIEATATGPFLVEPLASDEAASAVRRAIDLGGFVMPNGGASR